MNKVPFFLKLILMITFCILFYVDALFELKCVDSAQTFSIENTTKYYHIVYSEFYYSELQRDLNLAQNLVQNLFCCLIIFGINILTLNFMRKSLDVKRKLFNEGRPTEMTEIELLVAEKNQKRLNKMIIISSLMTMVGHLPSLVWVLSTYLSISISIVLCIYSMVQIFLLLSYSTSFFVYLYYLKKFKSFFKHRLLRFPRTF